MEATEISKLLLDNLTKVFTPSGYKHIIRKDNNLCRFNNINRMLIEIQCPNAFDARTTEEWIIDNRKVKKSAKAIYIVLPMYTYKYIDTKNNKEIKSNEFTLDEMSLAIKYGIIKREDKLETLVVHEVYDIRQTRALDDSKYTVSKPILRSSVLISMLQKITNCTVEYSEVMYYSKSKNEFKVSKQNYKELASTIVDILVEHYMDNSVGTLLEQYEESLDTISEYDKDLLRFTLQYSLDTLFRTGRDMDFDIVRHTNNDTIFMILNITESIMGSIQSFVEMNNDLIKGNIGETINNMKKAEMLLDIMEANDIRKVIEGK